MDGGIINKVKQCDSKVSEAFTSIKSQPLGLFFRVMSLIGSGPFCGIVYVLVLLVMPVWFHRVAMLLLAEAIGFAVVIALKCLIKRARPDPNYVASRLIPWDIFSFPSHHALRAFFLASILGHGDTVWFVLLSFVAVAIALSRIYLLKHFLSDVVVGAMLGVGIAWLVLHVPVQSFLTLL